MNPTDRRAAWVRALAVDEAATPHDLAERALAAATRAPREQPFVDAVLEQARRLVWWSGACATACAALALVVVAGGPAASSSSSSSLAQQDDVALVAPDGANPLVSWWDAHLQTGSSSWDVVLQGAVQR